MNEQELRELIAAVKTGRVSRRAFTRKMVGLGLTAPFVSQLVAHAGLAQSSASVDYKPTRAGGGGALRLLFWQAPTMVASLDGRTLISRWRPQDASRRTLFERLHERLACDAWLVGRITGQEYAKLAAYPDHTDQGYPREPWIARPDAAAYGIVLDAHGKIAWGRADIGDDPIVVVLTEKVSDAHLAGLRKDGVSYIFAGERVLDLGLALDDYLLGRLELSDRESLYESARVSLRRRADDRPVDLFELYWADLSRLREGGWRALTALYQLFFHLSTLAADVVDQVALATGGGAGSGLRLLQRLHACIAV